MLFLSQTNKAGAKYVILHVRFSRYYEVARLVSIVSDCASFVRIDRVGFGWLRTGDVVVGSGKARFGWWSWRSM